MRRRYYDDLTHEEWLYILTSVQGFLGLSEPEMETAISTGNLERLLIRKEKLVIAQGFIASLTAGNSLADKELSDLVKGKHEKGREAKS